VSRPLLQRQDKLRRVLVHQLNDLLEMPADDCLVVDLKETHYMNTLNWTCLSGACSEKVKENIEILSPFWDNSAFEYETKSLIFIVRLFCGA